MLVNDWYKGLNIFITGGTGFIGKVLVEKLLRSCPDVGNIYLLIRAKKGKSLEERLNDITSSPLFGPLKETNRKALSKIVPINGDIKEKGLGLTDEDRQLLIQKINVVFHAAASVRFDDPLKEAILINVRSAHEIALLALEMKFIQVFLHVSTAYCIDSTKTVVSEEIHPQCGNWRDALYIAENDDGELSSALLHKYIGGYANTYTFTKQLAEHCIKDLLQSKIPTIIARPTIVCNMINEPVKGFTDSLNGPVGISIAGCLGIMRVLFAKLSNRLDQIPVDMVVKSLILAVFNSGFRGLSDNISVIHIGSYGRTQVTIAEFINKNFNIIRKSPFQSAIWTVNMNITLCWYNYIIHVYLFQLLPAVFIDVVAKLTGYKPRLVKIQRKIFIAQLMLSYYMTRSWIFKAENCLKLFDNILESDKVDFFYDDVDDSQLLDYFSNCIDFIRKEILKEGNVKPTKINIQKIIRLADKVIKALFYILCLWIIFKLSVCIYNNNL